MEIVESLVVPRDSEIGGGERIDESQRTFRVLKLFLVIL